MEIKEEAGVLFSVHGKSPTLVYRVNWPPSNGAGRAGLFNSFVFLSGCLIIDVLCFGAARVGETEADMINTKKLERRAGPKPQQKWSKPGRNTLLRSSTGTRTTKCPVFDY